MTKLDLQTPDFVAANAARLAELFPTCVTETRQPDGTLKRAIDFDLLRQELAHDLVEGPQERYRLDWPGKREALALANAPIRKTLRPCKDESVDFETTRNLYIEGDNLDALKLLQETYLGKVKMIYIDPPYNTGNDFIYDDNFSISGVEHDLLSGTRNEEGNAMFQEEKWRQNSSASGRFHSEWLSMMYPRLKLARNLLKDNGVLFVSIDDNEVHNLRKVAEEVFGAANFVACFVWQKRVSPDNDEKHVTATHEYVLCFMKAKESTGIKGYARTAEQDDRYSNPDNDPRGAWTSSDLTRREFREHDFYEVTLPSGRKVTPAAGRSWSVPPTSYEKLLNDNRVWFGPNGDAMPRLKRFLSEVSDRVVPVTWLARELSGENQDGKRELNALFREETHVFDNPKPKQLLETLIRMTVDDGDLIMDFFSGSATTVHAAFQANAQHGRTSRFIAVQLPEAPNKGKFSTIAELGKERIRRAGTKIRKDLEDNLAKELPGSEVHNVLKSRLDSLDTGFRVLKIDSSNMADVYYQPDELTQDGLMLQVDNLRPGRKPEDLLFQVLLDWGVDLALPITEETILKRRVFFVAEDALAACFDTGLDEDFVKELAKRQPLRAVFRDSGYASDAVKINFEQIFKALSPHTELKTL